MRKNPSSKEDAPRDAAMEFTVGAALFGLISGIGSMFGSNLGVVGVVISSVATLVGVYVGGVRVARGIGIVVEAFAPAPTEAT
ncbi:hypothetical protein [Halopelagius longus]|uniref:Uncharacterized protein n=1 Tax=Halopelagius longus TaxID=1236180 RepID=A0A1H0XRY0_9EURY|nr:hypothetical protein [Halopelagius longus]RDI72049.1 hypothetical protein DWB78_10150 [Halopelagius longus]SDQ05662.1 hypothetical protein SAMN05216278_0137 [Halopelagius longus]